MSDDTTTTSTKTAPLSAEGQQWQSLLTGLITSNLDESGFSLNPTETTEYEDPSKSKSLQNQIDGTQAQLDQLSADLKSNPPPRGSEGKDPRQKQLNT